MLIKLFDINDDELPVCNIALPVILRILAWKSIVGSGVGSNTLFEYLRDKLTKKDSRNLLFSFKKEHVLQLTELIVGIKIGQHSPCTSFLICRAIKELCANYTLHHNLTKANVLLHSMKSLSSTLLYYLENKKLRSIYLFVIHLLLDFANAIAYLFQRYVRVIAVEQYKKVT